MQNTNYEEYQFLENDKNQDMQDYNDSEPDHDKTMGKPFCVISYVYCVDNSCHHDHMS
jgi:hypothetical protein